MNKDLYGVLGVERTADDKKLKSAYRKLAKKYHPDANPGDKDAEQKFKDVGEAYAILSDPEKRKLYDTYGYAAFDGTGGPAPGGGAGGPGGYQYYSTGGPGGYQSFHFSGEDAEDLFRSMFPAAGDRAAPALAGLALAASTTIPSAGSPTAADARQGSSHWI